MKDVTKGFPGDFAEKRFANYPEGCCNRVEIS